MGHDCQLPAACVPCTPKGSLSETSMRTALLLSNQGWHIAACRFRQWWRSVVTSHAHSTHLITLLHSLCGAGCKLPCALGLQGIALHLSLADRFWVPHLCAQLRMHSPGEGTLWRVPWHASCGPSGCRLLAGPAAPYERSSVQHAAFRLIWVDG